MFAGQYVEGRQWILDEYLVDVYQAQSPHFEKCRLAHEDELPDYETTQSADYWAAVDELCGYQMACAYVRPQGIHGLTPKSVKKKKKTPAFAAAINRDELREGAELLGVDFDEHLAFVIAALEERSAELALDGAEPAST